MAKYRNKTVEIEAVKWEASAESFSKIQAMGCPFIPGEMGTNTFYIPTLQGSILASPGDFIIKEGNGDFYPCKPDVFEKTYEEVHHE